MVKKEKALIFSKKCKILSLQGTLILVYIWVLKNSQPTEFSVYRDVTCKQYYCIEHLKDGFALKVN